MKTLNEIKEDVAKSANYTSWSEFYHEIINNKVGAAYIARMYDKVAVMYAHMALCEAADKVELFPQEQYDCEGGCTAIINKLSILNLTDQLK